MAKSTNAAKPKAVSPDSFLVVKQFVEKGLGHGLVSTEAEKEEIESALADVQKKVGYIDED